MACILFKQWDSDFFGKRTGLVKNEALLTERKAKKITEEAEKEGYSFLYYLPEVSQQSEIKALRELGFEYIDVHSTFVLDLKSLPSFPEPTAPAYLVKQPEETDYTKLKFLARELAPFSRFYLDSRIPKEKVKELYDIWLTNSFKGIMADYVYIIGERNNPLGFVTYKMIDREEIELSLIVIEEKEKGKGLGKSLVLSTLNELKKKARRCSVKVSLSNTPAVGFYESLGFHLREAHLVFHSHQKF